MTKQGKGVLTFAENTENEDYLRLALLQRRWLRQHNPILPYAVVVNSLSQSQLTDEHRSEFDYIIPIQEDWNLSNSSWRLQNESQVFQLTPFKETIKVEADLIIAQPIHQWWDALRLRDVVIAHGSVNYFGETNGSTHYRAVFQLNNLPDLYNGLMYFRFSETAYRFFETAKEVRRNWNTIVQQLKQCDELEPSTDLLYAVTARIVGEELVTLPLDFFRFCHMKAAHNSFPEGQEWWDYLLYETDWQTIRINHRLQHYPLHYQNKDFYEFHERYYPKPT